MWHKATINLKITIPLVILQTLIMIAGGSILISKIESTRFKELDTILETQTDILEGSVRTIKGQPEIPESGDLLNELDHDKNLYFQLISSEGKIVKEAKGPAKETRELLSQIITEIPDVPNRHHTFAIKGNYWRFTREKIGSGAKENSGGGKAVTLVVGINLTSSMKELSIIKQYIFAGVILLALITALGAFFIVVQSTDNIRYFASKLAKINPDRPVWKFDRQPKSAEEIQLFASFGALIHAIGESRETQRLFIANASHELKTPVAGILTALEVLLSHSRDAKDYESTCREILKAAKDMKKLTDALLNLALIEKLRPEMNVNVDLSVVITSVKERWLTAAAQKNITLQETCPPITIKAHANRELLEIALGNIVENAIKYSPSGKSIEIQQQIGSKGEPTITVIDEGQGMSADHLKNIGNTFFRADKSRTDKGSFGLGFAHADRIIKSFGGEISVKSTPNVGTTVTMHLCSAQNR